MKKLEWAILIGFVCAVILGSVQTFANECKQISQSVLRLHILANSDSEEDQQLKLRVRDCILQETGSLFEVDGNLEQVEESAREHLDEIQEIAQEEVYNAGYSYPVRAELVNMPFDTRTYGEITLPAGEYDAVRITIGNAEGHNWWCVLYPPLCIPAAEPQKQVEQVLDENQTKVVESNPKYEVRFAIVEWWEQLKQLF